ncbi:F-box/WD repeat-containing protein 4 [Cynoglossus semilaevis]|uniref:F-box/WD repeat-containing protein 4 n=1 Tax=Cynoglossus semilaevis TaxID=244447 RepID=UPI0007DC8687|nr:F-box/WD repeat-containing protein 4 [Cynoglossus semilaevis]
MGLLKLPDEVLYHILSYLDVRSLIRLSQVCRSARVFVNRDSVWRKIAKQLLNTGIRQDGTDIYPQISLKERVRVAQNWGAGTCRRGILLRWKTKLLPWLQLDGDLLFLSQAGDIGAYRISSGRLQRNPVAIYSGHIGDVCHFALTDSHLISGGSDGKIMVYNRRGNVLMQLSSHNQEVNCLDSKDGLIVSGSRDQTTRVWTLTSSCPRHTISMFDRVWSVAISPTQSTFVTGTACCKNLSPLRMWDVERLSCLYSLGSEYRHGAGVLDIVFESPYQLFTCGYDTYIRLWDLRVSPRYLQFFQLNTNSASSPVYSLRFSSTHLYAALATALHSLDFRENTVCIK